MKKVLQFLLLAVISLQLVAQAPMKFNYQAVLRDTEGNIMVNADVAVTINILQGSATGTEVFSETHNTSTNEFGLIILQIGSISPLNTVNWDAENYFLEIEVDGIVMGVTQLLSVPFALHAASAVPLSSFDALLEYLQNSGNVPLVDFSFSAHVVQPGELIEFSDNSLISGTSWDWDFGDGNTSQTQNPSHEYTETGSYDVSLTVSDGKITMTKILQDAITVNLPAVNLIQNGQFDDDSEWTIINFYECSNEYGLVTIADGYATWSETEAGPWKHMGIYQELELEAGTYNVDLWVEYSGIEAIWGEVYVGQTQPTPCTDEGGTDYTDNRVLVALNAWDCNTEYSGYAVANACNVPDGEVNGQFTIDVAGTYYFVFKVGGGSYGPDGIKVDDITLFKQ